MFFQKHTYDFSGTPCVSRYALCLSQMTPLPKEHPMPGRSVMAGLFCGPVSDVFFGGISITKGKIGEKY